MASYAAQLLALDSSGMALSAAQPCSSKFWFLGLQHSQLTAAQHSDAVQVVLQQQAQS